MTLDRRGLENEMRGARGRKLIFHFIEKFQQHERLSLDWRFVRSWSFERKSRDYGVDVFCFNYEFDSQTGMAAEVQRVT